MKVLVTGVYGFIGFSVAMRLLGLGHEVVGIEKLSNAISEKSARQKILEWQDGIRVYDLDMSDFERTKKLLLSLDFDCILHLAGQYSKPYSEDMLLRFIDGNIRTWAHLMHIATLKKIPRVVYATSTHVPLVGYPTNMYGATLMFREIASKTYNDMGIQTVAIRYSTTYGPFMRADSPPAQMMKKVFRKIPVDAMSSSFAGAYSWVYIADAVELTIRALTHELPTDHVQITAMANELPQNLATCLRLIEKYSGMQAIIRGEFPALKTPKLPEKQLEEMKRIFDFVPEWTLERGIEEYVRWYLADGKESY